MSDVVRQFTIQSDDDGIRLDRWFKRHLPQVGFATVSRWARTGQIRVDGKRVDPADRLATGQALRVPPGGDALDKTGAVRRELTEEQIERAEAMVLTQDRAAIVINKPPGLATQGGSGTHDHVDGLLDAFIAGGSGKSPPRPRLVHRLDKDTSGVLLVARTPGSAAFFSKRFSSRSARKVYWALVVGVPDVFDGVIELPLAKQPGTGGEKMMVDESGQGQAARTRYRVVDRAGNSAAWVELQPFTGRTHQLRVHMAAIGHPIVGDGKYGGKDAFLSGSVSRKMHLHARRLIIEHPDGAPLDVVAPLPEHFAASMEQLGFDESRADDLTLEAPPPSREVKKAVAKAHAKQYRKERRGERRGRTKGDRGPAGKTGGRPNDKPSGKPGGRPAGKPSGKPDGRPAGKPSGKPDGRSTGKSFGKPDGRPASKPFAKPAARPAARKPTARPPGKRP